MSKFKDLEIMVDEWNQSYPVGSKVIVTHDSGETQKTFTRPEAFVNPAGIPVIFLAGIRGYYKFDRVVPIL